jgi:hypothetical protein
MLTLGACLLCLLASVAMSWIESLSIPGAGSLWSLSRLSVVHEVVVLAACVAATWRGVEGGRWLAVAVMLLMFVRGAILSIVLGMSSASGAAGVLAAGSACLAAALVLWFSEGVGDFINRRLPSEVSADWDGVIKELVSAAAPRASLGSDARPPVSAEALLEGARKRRFWGTLSLAGIGFALLVSAALLAAFAVGTAAFLSSAQRDLAERSNEAIHATASAGNPIGALIASAIMAIGMTLGAMMLSILGALGLAFGYVVFFVAPFAATLPLTFPLAVSWTRPARFLLLRPFHRRNLTTGLVRFLRRHVVDFGHTYTLADTTLKVPWYVRVPALLGQVSLFSFRFRKIRHPAHVYRACRALRRTRLRNMNWLVSIDKVFALACSDAAWRAVVSRLLGEVDLVFIDMTGIRENVIWEVEQCIRLGKLDRVILVVDEQEREVAERALKGLFGGGAYSRELLAYDSTGARDEGSAAAVIARALAENGGPGAFPPPPLPAPRRDKLRLRTLRRGLIAFGVIGVILFITRVILGPPPALPVTSLIPLDGAMSVDLSADGASAITGGGDGNVRRIDVVAAREMGAPMKVTDSRVTAVALSPDGALLAARDWDGRTTVWELSSRRQVFESDERGMAESGSLSFRPDGRMLAVAMDLGGARLFPIPELSPATLLTAAATDRVAFAPDGTTLVAVSRWGSLAAFRIIDAAAERVASAEAPTIIDAMAIAPGGSRLATAHRDGIRIWDLTKGRLREERLRRTPHAVHDVAWGGSPPLLAWTTGEETYVETLAGDVVELAHPQAGERDRAWVFDIDMAEGGQRVVGVTTVGLAVWSLPSPLR